MVVAFKEENTVAFKHLFLKGYMDRMDDTYAVYTQTDVYDQIFFAINQVRIVAAMYTIYMLFTWVPFLLPSSLMVSEIELLCPLLKTRMLTHSGFLSLPEHCTCGDILKASQYTNSALNACLGFEPEFFASNKLGFLVRTVKRKRKKKKGKKVFRSKSCTYCFCQIP